MFIPEWILWTVGVFTFFFLLRDEDTAPFAALMPFGVLGYYLYTDLMNTLMLAWFIFCILVFLWICCLITSLIHDR